MATGPGQGNRSSAFEISEAVGDSPEQKAIQKCFVDLVEKVQPRTILPALYKEGLVSKVKYKDLSKEAKSGRDTSCNEDIIFALSDQQVHRYCKILLESDTAHQELGRKLHKELISCGCRPGNLPVLPVPELPDSTGSTDLLEAVSKFIGIEESPERQAIQRQLSSPGDSEQGLSKSLLNGKSSGVSVKVTDLPKNVSQQELNGMLRYGMSTFKPSDIRNVRVIQADVLSLNHAFIVCSSEEAAERVVTFLDGKEPGDANVKISAKVQTPQSQKAVVFPEKVKVHQLPKGLSKDRLLGYLGKELGSQVEIHMQGTSQELDYAWVNCTDRETASLVVEKLNGRQVEIQQGHSRIKHTIHAQPYRKEQNSLKVNHLPKRVTNEELKGVLAKTDPRVDVRILRIADQPDNYGYINCSSEENAKKIKEQLDGLNIDGNRLSVKFKGSVSHQRPGQGQFRHGSSSTSVKVNLPSSVTEADFVRLGSQQRGLKTAKFNRSTPAPHGFLVFSSKEDAEIAHENLTKLGYKVSLA